MALVIVVANLIKNIVKKSLNQLHVFEGQGINFIPQCSSLPLYCIFLGPVLL